MSEAMIFFRKLYLHISPVFVAHQSNLQHGCKDNCIVLSHCTVASLRTQEGSMSLTLSDLVFKMTFLNCIILCVSLFLTEFFYPPQPSC